MKNILTLFFIAACFVSPFKSLLPSATAQSWLWGRGGDGSGADSWAVATDNAGNVYGSGVNFSSSPITFGTVSLPPSVGSFQSFWVKYDPTGAVLWADGTRSGSTYLYSIATDPSGNLIVFGGFSSTTMQIGSITLTNTSTGSQYFLAKISPTGTVLWAVNDGNAPTIWITLLGEYILSTGAVTTDPAGNIFISSYYTKATTTIGTTTLTNADGSGRTSDIFVAKYSPSGTPLWASSVGGAGTDYAFGITVASTGDVYVSGAFSSASFSVGSSTLANPYTRPIAYIAKFSATGVPTWGQAAGGANGSFAVGIIGDNSGNVYMTGGFCDVSIGFGDTVITRTYTGSAPQLALFLVQYNVASNLCTWHKTIGSASAPLWGYCIALASCGQVWVSGNYTQAANIDGSILAVASGRDPIFIAGYNLTGGVVGYSGLGGGGDDQNGIACDAAGNVFLCSDYFTSLNVGTDVLTATGGSEYFYMAKYANVVSLPDTTTEHQDTGMLCNATTMILTAPAGYSTYYWDDGSGATTRTVTTTGTYYVYCTTCGDPVLIDTFHVSPLPSDTAYTATNDSVCQAIGSLVLTAAAGYTTYRWSTGATTSSITVTANGDYISYASAVCSLMVDTFHFAFTRNDSAFMHLDTSVCPYLGNLVLTAPAGYASYAWSTGATTSSITVTSSGRYIAVGTQGCNILMDTIRAVLYPIPSVSLGNDTAFCVGNSITLSSAQPPGTGYAWSTGSTASSITVSASAVYSLTVTNSNGCQASDNINVLVSPLPVVDLGPDTSVCTGNPLLLESSVTYPTGAGYIWNTGATTSSITALVIGTYWLQVTVGGCPNADTIVVRNLVDTLEFRMHDTAVCKGASITVIAAGSLNMTYQWLPTAGIPVSTVAGTIITPDTSATYVLRGSIPYCPDIVDSFHIDVQPNPLVYIGGNRFVCQFDSLHLRAAVTPAGYNNYIYNWTPALNLDRADASSAVFVPGATTKMMLTVTTPAGCSGKDSALLTVYPGNFASMDTSLFQLCPHDSVVFNAISTDPGTHYHWYPSLYISNPMSSTPVVYPLTNQNYFAIATSQYGCRDTIFASVVVSPAAEINLADSVTIYPGESYTMNTQGNCNSFIWFPPSGLNSAYVSNPVASPVVSTKYIVYATNESGCKTKDSIDIYVSSASLIDVPNAFVPGSGANGVFRLIKKGIATINYFRVYNRWGNMVFETADIDAGWDGAYKGNPQPYDVYVYEVEAVASDGTVFRKKGNVTLIR